jgi:hypothetical protein
MHDTLSFCRYLGPKEDRKISRGESTSEGESEGGQHGWYDVDYIFRDGNAAATTTSRKGSVASIFDASAMAQPPRRQGQTGAKAPPMRAGVSPCIHRHITYSLMQICISCVCSLCIMRIMP